MVLRATESYICTGSVDRANCTNIKYIKTYNDLPNPAWPESLHSNVGSSKKPSNPSAHVLSLLRELLLHLESNQTILNVIIFKLLFLILFSPQGCAACEGRAI